MRSKIEHFKNNKKGGGGSIKARNKIKNNTEKLDKQRFWSRNAPKL
jgi:hypothetical protein